MKTLQLVAENLGQRFGRRVLFRRLSFTVSGGASLAVTGANGSGKSTLLRILCGVLSPTTGTVTLHMDGALVPTEEHPLQAGLVAPYLNVYDGFSARENLQFIARLRRIRDATRRIEAVLETVELSRRADEPVATFSSGMKQRVKYAAACLSSPAMLLLDEPSTNLDAAGLAMVRRIVESQQKDGRIVVIATNDPDEASSCDQVIRIEDYL